MSLSASDIGHGLRFIRLMGGFTVVSLVTCVCIRGDGLGTAVTIVLMIRMHEELRCVSVLCSRRTGFERLVRSVLLAIGLFMVVNLRMMYRRLVSLCEFGLNFVLRQVRPNCRTVILCRWALLLA